MNFSCLFLRRHQLLIHEIVAKQWRIREDILPGLHEHTTQFTLCLNTEGHVGQTSHSQPSEATLFSPPQCSSPHQPVPGLLWSSGRQLLPLPPVAPGQPPRRSLSAWRATIRSHSHPREAVHTGIWPWVGGATAEGGVFARTCPPRRPGLLGSWHLMAGPSHALSFHNKAGHE